MDDPYSHLGTSLRQRVSRLLDDGAKWKSSRAELLTRLREFENTAFLFGGAVRDLMLCSPYHAFRDIDVVVRGVTTGQLLSAFSEYVVRTTRFGGLHLDAEGWLFDLWPLEETWAFRQFPLLLQPNPEELPRTTFLTVEAIVVSLGSKRGKPRELFQSGFFESIATKTVELNFEATPYPALNIVRSLLASWRLGFSIGPRLSRFICHNMEELTIEELVESQRNHYGYVPASKDRLSRRLDVISHWRRWHPSLSVPADTQDQLWLDWNEHASLLSQNRNADAALAFGCEDGYPVA